MATHWIMFSLTDDNNPAQIRKAFDDIVATLDASDPDEEGVSQTYTIKGTTIEAHVRLFHPSDITQGTANLIESRLPEYLPTVQGFDNSVPIAERERRTAKVLKFNHGATHAWVHRIGQAIADPPLDNFVPIDPLTV